MEFQAIKKHLKNEKKDKTTSSFTDLFSAGTVGLTTDLSQSPGLRSFNSIAIDIAEIAVSEVNILWHPAFFLTKIGILNNRFFEH